MHLKANEQSKRTEQTEMEFQRENYMNFRPADEEYVCDCGCGTPFIYGVELGFKIMIGPNDVLLEDKIAHTHWNEYIPMASIKTWGELMDLITISVRDNPNDRAWCHLEGYLEKRNEMPDETPLSYIYFN